MKNICILLAVASLGVAVPAQASPYLDTKHLMVVYNNEGELKQFLKRVTGTEEIQLAVQRLDALVERVQDILDIHNESIQVVVELSTVIEKNNFGSYSNKTKRISINVKGVTDGVLAHEIAHAILDKDFSSLPENCHEILAQHVDKELWREI